MNDEAAIRNRGFRILMSFAALVIIIAGMRAAAGILTQVLLATLVAVLAAGPVGVLRRRMPTGLAVALVVLGLLGVTVVVAGFVGASMADFTRDLPRYEQAFSDELAGTYTWLRQHGVTVPEGGLTEAFDPSELLSIVGYILNGLRGLLTNGAIILLIVVFMLLEASGWPTKILAVFGEGSPAMAGFRAFSDTVKRYLAIKSLMSMATGGTVVILLLLTGVDNPILWGFLAFLLNFIPNIGSIIAAVPPVALALVQFGWARGLGVALGYLAVNTFWSNLVEPRVMGRGVGLSPLVIFLSLIFWAFVLGPVGMVLSVPLTMIVKIALESHPRSRSLAILLGSRSEAIQATTEYSVATPGSS